MIISRTPYRVSFVGGGSDLPSYFENRTGAVISTTIDKYIYVTVNARFDDSIRVSYTNTEIVDSVNNLEHELVREALKFLDLDGGLEITTVGEIPGGTGLGSSSAVTVGLLKALHAYKGEFSDPNQLAEEACKIEIDNLGKPIGKQDQYAAAFGNLNHIQFNTDGSVYVEPVISSEDTKEKLNDNLLLFYTGLTRDSEDILKDQKKRTASEEKVTEILDNMVEFARDLNIIIANGDLSKFGELLHENWKLKKQLSSKISSDTINEWYNAAMESGALGGKILGAGGGGFFLIYCELEHQDKLRQRMSNLGLVETEFNFDHEGTKIVYIES